LKLVQEGAGNRQKLTGIGNDFFDVSQNAQQLRERIGKCDYMELKTICTKEMV
jgi:hypothetical protein